MRLTPKFENQCDIPTIGILPSKFMGGNAIFRSNHLTWEKVPPPPGGGGGSGEISVKSRFESKFSVKSPVYFWVENLGQNAI